MSNEGKAKPMRFDYDLVAELEDPKKIAKALAAHLRMQGFIFGSDYPFFDEVEEFTKEVSSGELSAIKRRMDEMAGKKVAPVGQGGEA